MFRKIVAAIVTAMLMLVPLGFASGNTDPLSQSATNQQAIDYANKLQEDKLKSDPLTWDDPNAVAENITVSDQSEQASVPPAPQDPFNFNCKAALLIDSDTGTVLYEKNADSKLPVASVTKVMTLLLTFDALNQGKFGLDDTVTISLQAAGMGGSQALLDANGKYKVSELIKSIIVASANDSSVAMAEYLFGSETLFVDEMNKRAEELGMANTHFVNCTGLPAQGQYTSVTDVSRMSRELIKYPMFYQYSKVWMYEMQHANARITQLSNTNKLTRFYDGCDGIKTGSTDEAGYCLTATAKRGESRFIAVIAGSATSVERNAAISKMLDYAFATYKSITIYDQGGVVKSNVVVWGGQLSTINAVSIGKISILVKKGEENKVDKIVEIYQPVRAPVERGAQIGTVKVLKGGQQIAEYPLVADRTVEEAGFWTNMVKILDSFK